MKITVEDANNIVRIKKELFAPDQSAEETVRDYRTLVESMDGCYVGNCERCIFGGLDMGGRICNDELMRIAARQIEKLVAHGVQ